MTCPIALATCTEGPSFPTDNPEAIAIGCSSSYTPNQFRRQDKVGLGCEKTYESKSFDSHRFERKKPSDEEP